MRNLLNGKALLALLILAMCLSFTATSHGLFFVSVKPEQVESPRIGDELSFSIQIVGGLGVAGYQLTVEFDPTVLRYIGGNYGDYLPSGALAVPVSTTDNSVSFTATSVIGEAVVIVGTLATVTFEVIDSKPSAIRLMDVVLSDINGMPLEVFTYDSTIVESRSLAWDVNQDGIVNILDLTLIASNLGAVVPTNPRADANSDGTVNVLDLVLVASNLGAVVEERTPPAAFVSAHPASGAIISANASVTVTFDNSPPNLSVSVGSVTVAGKTATIAGPFAPGLHAFTLTWDDGTQTLNYIVTVPDNTPPTVTGGTVSDGDKAVDSEQINTDAKIEVTFSEDVTGNIALQTEDGYDVGWLGKVEGAIGTLELVKGKEIITDTYVIVGKVSDSAGNSLDVNITFDTQNNVAPYVVSGTVLDGDVDVDPELINSEEAIEIVFNEKVTGTIELQDVWGDDVGWLGWVEDDNIAYLFFVEGAELESDTIYVIVGNVADDEGNETEISITFVTQ